MWIKCAQYGPKEREKKKKIFNCRNDPLLDLSTDPHTSSRQMKESQAKTQETDKDCSSSMKTVLCQDYANVS